MAPKVHILHEGRSLCGISERYGTPNLWPEGHVWVGRSESVEATCVRCRALLKSESHPRT